MKINRGIAFCLSLALLLACACPMLGGTANAAQMAEEDGMQQVSDLDLMTYGQYIQAHGGTVSPVVGQEIAIAAADFTAYSGEQP